MNEPTEGKAGVIECVGVLEAMAATATGSVRTRMNFSFHHLMAAARLARAVADIEQRNAGQEFGAFYEIILGSSLGCIVLSLAAAEAYVNELFADRAEHFPARDAMLLDLLWKDYEEQRLLDKFDLAHRLRAGTPIDRGTAHVQAMDRLTKLRNGIAHFKPEWDDEAANHEKLSKQLEGYVARSPWLPNELLFPRAWATTGTAAWAISTVLTFVAKFSDSTGLPDRFGPHKERFAAGI
jgi:hypothetical protein